MKEKLVLLSEIGVLIYMAVMIWLLVPALRAPALSVWTQALYRWQLGKEEERNLQRPGWMQEALIVRGKLRPRILRP